ncbi:MAG: exodeoxyribonuclease small subunit [Verrucomicrobiota bacterium]|jgi:exodeoxyribonuclease VII small subunit
MTSVKPVPNALKNSNAPAGAKEAPFEEALKKLESIVEQMEAGELPLETMMTRFEEGVRLVKTCQARLEEAELKISQLDQDSSGAPILKPASLLPNDDE